MCGSETYSDMVWLKVSIILQKCILYGYTIMTKVYGKRMRITAFQFLLIHITTGGKTELINGQTTLRVCV